MTKTEEEAEEVEVTLTEEEIEVVTPIEEEIEAEIESNKKEKLWISGIDTPKMTQLTCNHSCKEFMKWVATVHMMKRLKTSSTNTTLMEVELSIGVNLNNWSELK